MFDARQRALLPVELDESLAWWRLPDSSGAFDPRPVVAAEPAPFVAGLPAPPPPTLIVRLRDGFAVPDINTARVRKRQDWLAKRPELTQRILERGGIYLHHILDEVERRGLPTEIALIPFIESGFDPEATSAADAAGLWQFIPRTATRYKLRVDAQRDERRDVIDSTRAALDYLEFLYRQFGDWQLAFAAYNWGEEAVGRAVERNRGSGRSIRFEHLSLPEETQDYLPKLQAVKNLVRQPASFGIALPELPNRPFFTTVHIATHELKLADAARLAGMPLRDFSLLNAGYRDRLIRRGQRVIVPLDRQLAFESELDRLPVRATTRR